MCTPALTELKREDDSQQSHLLYLTAPPHCCYLKQFSSKLFSSSPRFFKKMKKWQFSAGSFFECRFQGWKRSSWGEWASGEKEKKGSRFIHILHVCTWTLGSKLGVFLSPSFLEHRSTEWLFSLSSPGWDPQREATISWENAFFCQRHGNANTSHSTRFG